MTAETATQPNSNASGTLMPTLALAFAILTLLLAALSMVFGNRLVTLQNSHTAAQQEAAVSEAMTVEKMQATINTIQKALEAEKATAAKLRTQIAAANKALKKTKAELASAKATIESLKPTPTEMPLSSPETTTPPAAPVTQTETPEPPPVTAPLPEKSDGAGTVREESIGVPQPQADPAPSAAGTVQTD
jgi:DNA-binding FrmR family transcriptional regulator